MSDQSPIATSTDPMTDKHWIHHHAGGRLKSVRTNELLGPRGPSHDDFIACGTTVANAAGREVAGRVIAMLPRFHPIAHRVIVLDRYTDQWDLQAEDRLHPLPDSENWSMCCDSEVGGVFVTNEFARRTPVHGIAFPHRLPTCIVFEYEADKRTPDQFTFDGFGVVELTEAAVDSYAQGWRDCPHFDTHLRRITLCNSNFGKGGVSAFAALQKLRRTASELGIHVDGNRCAGHAMSQDPRDLLVLDLRDRNKP